MRGDPIGTFGEEIRRRLEGGGGPDFWDWFVACHKEIAALYDQALDDARRDPIGLVELWDKIEALDDAAKKWSQ